MNSSIPDYLRRYLDEYAEGQGDGRLLSYFDCLNEKDWEEFITDIVKKDGRAWKILEPQNEDELVSIASNFFQRASPAVQRIAAQGIERLVISEVVYREAKFTPQEIHSLCSLAALLVTGVDVQAYVDIANDPKVDQQNRIEAGRVIANHEDIVPINIWQSLDLELTPELTPVVLLGFADHDDIPNAMKYVARSISHLGDAVSSTKVVMRELFFKALDENGVQGVQDAVHMVVDNESLYVIALELLWEHEPMSSWMPLPSRIIREEAWKFGDEIIVGDTFFNQWKWVIDSADATFALPQTPNYREQYDRNTVEQTNSILGFLSASIRGAKKNDYIISVCRRLLETRGIELPSNSENKLSSFLDEDKWNEDWFEPWFDNVRLTQHSDK